MIKGRSYYIRKGIFWFILSEDSHLIREPYPVITPYFASKVQFTQNVNLSWIVFSQSYQDVQKDKKALEKAFLKT